MITMIFLTIGASEKLAAAIANVGMGSGYDRCSPLTCRWVGGVLGLAMAGVTSKETLHGARFHRLLGHKLA